MCLEGAVFFSTALPFFVSIGDYVLTNGCLAACVLIDAVSRFVPGVLKEEAVSEESFENDLLEYPQYTRPEVFEGKEVPKVLLEGDHKKIDVWHMQHAIEATKKSRPDLYHAWLYKQKVTPLEVSPKKEQASLPTIQSVVLGTKDLQSCAKLYKKIFGVKKVV